MAARRGPQNQRRRGPRFTQNLMAALEISDDLACLCAEGIVLDINTAGARLLGAPTTERVVGRPFLAYVHHDYAGAVDELLRLRDIAAEPFPVHIVRLDEIPFEAELRIHPARELGPLHTVITCRDTTRQSRLARSARDSADRFRLFVENSMHLIAHCCGATVTYMNPAGMRLLKLPAARLAGGFPVADLFHGEYRALFAADLGCLLAEGDALPVRLARTDSAPVDAQILVTHLSPTSLLADDMPEYMIEARDISAQNRAVTALRHINDHLEQRVEARTAELAEERRNAVEARLLFEGLLQAVPNPLWWKDLGGRFLGYNHAFAQAHAIGARDWLGLTTASVLPSRLVEPAARSDARAMEGNRVQFEARLVLGGAEERDVVISKTAYPGPDRRPGGVIGVMLDITERKAMEEELRRLATTDALTGVANRRQFMDNAAVEVSRARRHGRPLVAVMLDIDHFKNINDAHGHPVGDRAIRATADTCAETLRNIDRLGRVGGEEFALLLPDTTAAAALPVAERLRQAVAAIRIPVPGGAVAFTISIGLAELTESDTSAEPLLSRADQALYRAKAGGRNRVEVA